MFEGAGVSYWASPVEAKLCEGEDVALVGAGNSAGQAVVFLAPKVRRLKLVVQGGGYGSDDVAVSDRPILTPPNVELDGPSGGGRVNAKCLEEVCPGLEQEVCCDGPQALEEPLTCHQFPPRCTPGPVPQFTYGMTGESQQIEDREHGRQMLLSMPEVMLEVVSLGFQDIEALIFNLPSGSAAGGRVRRHFPVATSRSVMKLLR